ncbi:MAG: GMC family oxidoreductase N-terminal domain-containing protein [Polaromonas sp.]|uniref:GMC family oxidoreductase n=1 Tax=Polaromonas sp. TaxID=1869339 RepID=UPI002734F6BC|nr:GMC family oxidoreductase N-terminal domain-containing protein [Polaromonas sp.]MDP2820209.1 GMC family oxidoreductase N-terminal domain-containing protein [Polaromonas sp.]
MTKQEQSKITKDEVPFTRRRFIKSAGIASGTLMVGGLMVGAKINAAVDKNGSFDYVIVGAGSAGCVLANRLTENPNIRVLLIEAGGPDNSEKISTPIRLIELWKTPYDWAYDTAPQKHAHNRPLYWPRGKTLGGSSSLNGMIYVRGHSSVYDGWAKAGNKGWDYKSILPYFKKSENYDRGANEFHGQGGPLQVTTRYTPHIVTKAMVDAAVQAGHPLNTDHNGAEILGAGFNHLNTKDGKRHSTAVAFLRPALDRGNLSVITNARVHKVAFTGKRCNGVVYEQDGKVHNVSVRKEVILSGGTLESPKILLLSGIGDSKQLSQFGIPVVHHLPGVGKNLHDHTLLPVIYESKKPIPAPNDPTITVLHGQLFAKSDERLPGPDMQPLFFHVPYYAPGQEGPANAFTLSAAGVTPTSRGELRLTGGKVGDPLHIDPNVLATDYDIKTLVTCIKAMRKVADQPALAEWRGREVFPGPEKTSDKDLAEYCRSAVVSYHHQVGTCAMGQSPMSVVNHELKVHGVTGLRVVDASIMPAVSSGNTNAPTIMIAEKAADMIKAAA